MYKVLFAEDELLVRLGLQNSIPWSKYEMEVAALAENGLEAYRLFEKIHPDILITDLRMEGMDGLELVKRVRQIDKECAIVVISCLNDFETLRKIIRFILGLYFTYNGFGYNMILIKTYFQKELWWFSQRVIS